MKKIILSAIFIITLVSCKKEAGPQGPAGTNGTNGTNGTSGGGTTGSIAGKIKQYDQFGTQYATGLNTVTLSVEGATNMAVTDAAGSYTITNLVPGIYDIDIQKPGCGLRKIQQITFPGNGTLYFDDATSDKATYTFTAGYIKDTTVASTPTLRLNLAYAAVPKNRSCIIFYSTTNNIDPTNPATYDSYQTMILSANTSTFSNNTSFGNNYFYSFPATSTFYAKIYPNTYSVYSYYDYPSSKQVFTGCGTAIPTTFTLTMP